MTAAIALISGPNGGYPPSVRALSVAVARNNESMVRLLFPVSDKGRRKKALKAAAQTNGLEMVQLLMKLGVDLDMTDDVINPHNTLLVDAAEGASMNTGRWLLDVQQIPPTPLKDLILTIAGPLHLPRCMNLKTVSAGRLAAQRVSPSF